MGEQGLTRDTPRLIGWFPILYLSHPRGRAPGLLTYTLAPGRSEIHVESAPGLIPCFPASVRLADWHGDWDLMTPRLIPHIWGIVALCPGRCATVVMGRVSGAHPPCLGGGTRVRPSLPLRTLPGSWDARVGWLAAQGRFTPPRLLLSRSPSQPGGRSYDRPIRSRGGVNGAL